MWRARAVEPGVLVWVRLCATRRRTEDRGIFWRCPPRCQQDICHLTTPSRFLKFVVRALVSAHGTSVCWKTNMPERKVQVKNEADGEYREREIKGLFKKEERSVGIRRLEINLSFFFFLSPGGVIFSPLRPHCLTCLSSTHLCTFKLSLLFHPAPQSWRKVQSLHFHCGCPDQRCASWKFHLPSRLPPSLRLHRWPDPAPRVKNDDEMTLGERRKAHHAGLHATRAAPGVNDNGLDEKKNKNWHCLRICAAQPWAKICSFSDFRPLCFTDTKIFWENASSGQSCTNLLYAQETPLKSQMALSVTPTHVKWMYVNLSCLCKTVAFILCLHRFQTSSGAQSTNLSYSISGTATERPCNNLTEG